MTAAPALTLNRTTVHESTFQDSNNNPQVGSLKGRTAIPLSLKSGEKGGADWQLIAIGVVAFIALLAARIALRFAIIGLVNNPVVGLSILGAVALIGAVAAAAIYFANQR